MDVPGRREETNGVRPGEKAEQPGPRPIVGACPALPCLAWAWPATGSQVPPLYLAGLGSEEDTRRQRPKVGLVPATFHPGVWSHEGTQKKPGVSGRH